MENDIISYQEMCQREKSTLQRGMNYRIGGNYSVVLVSFRRNAPYEDMLLEDGITLIYEGHDAQKNFTNKNPKYVDQPEYTPKGSLTENGKFHQAAQEYKRGNREPELVKVYEKMDQGIWSFNGFFKLIDSWNQIQNKRNVFKFKMIGIPYNPEINSTNIVIERRRIIPTKVKIEVWKRDKGRCVICGSNDELHFDHVLPFSKGGTSFSAKNVQLLCARHNLEKSDKII